MRGVPLTVGLAAVIQPSVPIVVVGPHIPLIFRGDAEAYAEAIMEWMECEVMVVDEPVYEIHDIRAAIEIKADLPDAYFLKNEPTSTPEYRRLEYGKKKRRW